MRAPDALCDLVLVYLVVSKTSVSCLIRCMTSVSILPRCLELFVTSLVCGVRGAPYGAPASCSTVGILLGY